MTTYGVIESGFLIKPYDVMLDEMKKQARAQFGDDVDLSPTSPLYKFIEATAFEMYRVWEMAEGVYYSGYLDTASDDNLDRVVKLLGVIRIPANKATGIVRFFGTDGITVPVGAEVQTTDALSFYTTESGVTSGGYVDIAVECSEYGEIGNVAASTIIVLVTSIPNITGVDNLNPTSGGEERETDSSLRLRTTKALEEKGKATLVAIEAAVLAVPGVTAVLVTENLTNHSIAVYVEGITYPDQDVEDAVNGARAAGIAADTGGQTWDNPTAVDIYVDTTVACTNEPADAATQIENKIIEYVNDLGIGADVIYSKLYDVIFNEFDWVDDVTALTLDTVTPPVGTSNISIAANQIALTDAGKIGVTIT